MCVYVLARRIGQVAVTDLTDGRFAVDYYFYRAGTYRVAVHGVGKGDTEIEAEMTNPESFRQPYDSVDSVGIEVLFKLHAASI
jgi:hypothetical protein